MRKCTCPNCNANLQFGEDREFGFCEFCGTKILLDDYRTTHRFVDEAKVHEVDAMTMLRLKELELEEKRDQEKKEKLKMKFKVLAVFNIIVVAATLISLAICALINLLGGEIDYFVPGMLFYILVMGDIGLGAFMFMDPNKNNDEKS